MKKKVNKKLALNKEKISELSRGNMGKIRGGGTSVPETEGEFCYRDTFAAECWISELYTACCPETFAAECYSKPNPNPNPTFVKAG